MFKVSLLPDGYRRHLEGRKKVDLVSKVALVVLVCLFIVYGGVTIKGQILKSKLSKIQQKNSQLEAEFPALQEYQLIYDNLLSAQKMIESILPKESEAVDFFTKVVAFNSPLKKMERGCFCWKLYSISERLSRVKSAVFMLICVDIGSIS